MNVFLSKKGMPESASPYLQQIYENSKTPAALALQELYLALDLRA
jgi:hypothetical protein